MTKRRENFVESREERRDKLIAAARELFRERGFEAVSPMEIVTLANSRSRGFINIHDFRRLLINKENAFERAFYMRPGELRGTREMLYQALMGGARMVGGMMLKGEQLQTAQEIAREWSKGKVLGIHEASCCAPPEEKE